MRRKKMSFTTRYVLAFGLLMLAANIILGAAILFQTQATLKDLINTNMLDVVRTAAELEDGDALAAMTEADVDSEAYRGIVDRLLVFQNHDDIKYIYIDIIYFI